MSNQDEVTRTNEDAVSLRAKLNAFAATLTAGEYALLAQLLERASHQDEHDTSGYFWWFFQPQPPQVPFNPGANLISVNHAQLIGKVK